MRNATLQARLPPSTKSFSYSYDFGDGWEHTLRVERTLPIDPALHYPLCMAGAKCVPAGRYRWTAGLRRLRASHLGSRISNLALFLYASNRTLLMQESIIDRLDNGDPYVVGGEVKRKPVSARDLALVAAITFDKRQLARATDRRRRHEMTTTFLNTVCDGARASYWHTVPGGRKTWRIMALVCETPLTV
jgi:hypothetical protein